MDNVQPAAENQLDFYTAVFGQNSTEVAVVKTLISKGMSFPTMNPFVVKGVYNGKTYSTQLNVSRTALMKHSPDKWVFDTNVFIIRKLLEKCWSVVVPAVVFPLEHLLAPPPVETKLPTPTTLPPPPEKKPLFTAILATKGTNITSTIKVLRNLFGISLKDAKDLIDNVPSVLGTNLTEKESEKIIGTISNYAKVVAWDSKVPLMGVHQGVLGEATFDLSSEVKDPKSGEAVQANEVSMVVKGKPTAELIPLKNAKALGQRVKGTEPGSVYRCIAWSNTVKLAVKMVGGGLSFRAETSLANMDEQTALASVLDKKAGYYSLHLHAGDVPKSRILGSVLFGLGIHFTEQIQNLEEMGSWS